MGGYIVRTFIIMDIVIRVFRNHYIDMALKVHPYRWICIFIQGQTRGSMFYKDMQGSDLDVPKFRKCADYLLGDQMKSPGLGPQFNFLLVIFYVRFFY